MDDEIHRAGIKEELTTRNDLPVKCFLSRSGHDLRPLSLKNLTDSDKRDLKSSLLAEIERLEMRGDYKRINHSM